MSARGVTAHVVGGAVRDRVLGRAELERRDLDLAVAAPVVELAGDLAVQIGATAVVMDPERGYIRLVATGSDDEHGRIDLTGYEGGIGAAWLC